jgi:hypothetical protein
VQVEVITLLVIATPAVGGLQEYTEKEEDEEQSLKDTGHRDISPAG